MTEKTYTKIQKTLRGIALFSVLAPGQLDVLARATSLRQIARGTVIYRSGDPASEVLYLLSGHVKRTTEPQGHEGKVLDLIYPGQIFGEAEVIAASPRTSFALAVEQSQLLSIGGKALSDLLQTVPQLAMRLMTVLAQRQLEMENDTLSARSLDGHQRLLDYLLQQSGHLSATDKETLLHLPSSKRLIAARLGMTPENLSRCLRSLSDDALINVQGRNIWLKNAAIRQHLAKESRPPGLSMYPASLQQVTPKPSRTPLTKILPATINKAGRLRMLSQRMAKCWLMIARRVSPMRARKMLQQSILTFDEQVSEIKALNLTPEARAAFATVLELWPDYRTLLESPPNAENARLFFRLSERSLMAAHAFTLAIEQATNAPENHLINLAGRERMLSQRMAKFFMFLDWQPTGIDRMKCHKELHRSMQEFETTLARLTRKTLNQPDLHHQLVAVASQWQQMRSALDAPNEPADPRTIHRQTGAVCSFSEQLLREMDAAVALYEKKLTA